MKESKKQTKTNPLVTAGVALFLPVLLPAFGWILLRDRFESRDIIKEFNRSRYKADQKVKFSWQAAHSPQYRFYDSAILRSLSFDYRRQSPKGPDYFIMDGTVYLFPDFSYLEFDEKTGCWLAIEYDGEANGFDSRFAGLAGKLKGADGLPVKLLVERRMIQEGDLSRVVLPGSVYLIGSYETAFSPDDEPLKTLIVKSTAELYELMKNTPFLCGKYVLKDNGNGISVIEWAIGGTLLELCVGHGDGWIGVREPDGSESAGAPSEKVAVSWNTNADEIYDEVCTIGRPGNVLVVDPRRGGFVLYEGEKEKCPYLSGKKRLPGKMLIVEAK